MNKFLIRGKNQCTLHVANRTSKIMIKKVVQSTRDRVNKPCLLHDVRLSPIDVKNWVKNEMIEESY